MIAVNAAPNPTWLMCARKYHRNKMQLLAFTKFSIRSLQFLKDVAFTNVCFWGQSKTGEVVPRLGRRRLDLIRMLSKTRGSSCILILLLHTNQLRSPNFNPVHWKSSDNLLNNSEVCMSVTCRRRTSPQACLQGVAHAHQASQCLMARRTEYLYGAAIGSCM